MSIINLIFTIIAVIIALIACFYLYKRYEKDKEEELDKTARFAVEEVEAEEWLNQDFTPLVLHFIKKHLWEIIIVSALLLWNAVFLWSFQLFGFDIAIKNGLIAEGLFFLCVGYTLLFLNLGKFIKNNWLFAYLLLLLPVIFFLKVNFVTYSLSFAAAFFVIKFIKDMQKDEQDSVDKEAKRMLEEKK
jgi:hypothetical protein